jgi:hypothetical protein
MNPERTIIYYLTNLLKADEISFIHSPGLKSFTKNLFPIRGFTERGINSMKNDISKTISKEVSEELKKYEYSEVFFNQSVVLFVSSLECFLKDLFISLIDDDKEILDKISKSDNKIVIRAKDLFNKQMTIGEKISRNYNFQNLNSVKDAYNNILNINIIKALSFDSVYNSKKINSLVLLKRLIEMRHQIIHNSKNCPLTYSQIKEARNMLIHLGLGMFSKIVVPSFIKKRKQ